MSKEKKKKKEVDATLPDATDMQTYALDFDEMVDAVHKEVDIMPVALNRADFVVNAVPTGILTVDLIIGGGWHHGKWIVLFGLEGSGKCQSYETLIPTKRGFLRIGELFDETDSRDSYMRTGLIATGNKLAVYDRIYRRPVDKMLVVRTVAGRKLKMTHDHKVRVLDSLTCSLEWKEIQNVTKTDYLLNKVGADVWAENYATVDSKRVTSDVARIMGMLIADGSLGGGQTIFASSRLDILQLYKDLCLKVFGVAPKEWQKDGKYVLRIRADFLKKCGLSYVTSRKKSIPWSILQSPRHVVVEFLRGYFTCDYSGVTASKKLAQELCILLDNLGIYCTIRRMKKQASVNGTIRWYYELNIPTMEHRHKFYTVLQLNDDKLFSKRGVENPYFASFRGHKELDALENVNDYNYTYDFLKPVFDKIHATYCTRNGVYQKDDKSYRLSLTYDKNVTKHQLLTQPSMLLGLQMYAPTAHNTIRYILDNDLILDQVDSLKDVEGGTVYDVQVPGSHEFLANNFVVHNSTTLYFSLTQAIALGIPVVFLDYEVSTDPDYLSRILNQPIDKLFGKKDDQGKWVTKPMVRYEQPETAEKGFRLMHRILKKLPNKIQDGDAYYFVYDPEIHKDIEKKLKAANVKYQKDAQGKFRVRCQNGLPQIIFFVDSFIAMFPEARDNDDEKSAMAQVARVFSENAAMVKSRLGSKRACIIGTNQMRLRPGGYGDPSYEPGGETIKFFSDIRVRTRTIAIPDGTGQVEEEDCWDGDGIDRYRYVSVSVPKNKVFSPFRQSTLRFWFEEKGRPGRGIDPVFDCFQFLEETGQVSGKGRYTLTVPGPWTNRTWTWKEFKRLILNPDRYEVYKEFGFGDAEIDAMLKEFKKAGGASPYVQYEDKTLKKLAKEIRMRLERYVDICGTCRRQIQDSSAFHLYFSVAGKTNKATVVSDVSKTCRNCKNWKVTKACKKTKPDEGCKDWEAKDEPKNAKKGTLKALAQGAKKAIDDVVDTVDAKAKAKKGRSMTLDD